MISEASQIEDLAKSVDDNGGAYCAGVLRPVRLYWRADARGALVGLTRYVNKGGDRRCWRPRPSRPVRCSTR